MAQPPNSQVGIQFATRSAPLFTGYVVKGGTWKPESQLKSEMLDNADEEPINHTFWAPGTRATCEMMQKVDADDLVESLVITEAGEGGDKWLVEKCNPIVFGKRASRFSVTICKYDSENLSLVSGGA